MAVLLFGYAGSSFRQLEKHSLMYNKLGYTTLSCILPQNYLFHFEVPKIVECSKQVLERVKKENINEIATITFSNNGAALYQHLSQLILQDNNQEIRILGAVFDSGPGPNAIFRTSGRRVPHNTPNPPTKFFLYLSLLGVNLANGVSIRESLHLLSKQIKSTNIDPNVSWPGHFLKYEDRGRWPLFIIYSKKDKLLPWQFLKKLVEETSENGRQVEEWQLKDSGHVAHYKFYPIEYRDKVSKFLQKIQQ